MQAENPQLWRDSSCPNIHYETEIFIVFESLGISKQTLNTPRECFIVTFSRSSLKIFDCRAFSLFEKIKFIFNFI